MLDRRPNMLLPITMFRFFLALNIVFLQIPRCHFPSGAHVYHIWARFLILGAMENRIHSRGKTNVGSITGASRCAQIGREAYGSCPTGIVVD